MACNRACLVAGVLLDLVCVMFCCFQIQQFINTFHRDSNHFLSKLRVLNCLEIDLLQILYPGFRFLLCVLQDQFHLTLTLIISFTRY